MADPTTSTDGATKNYVDTTTAAFFSTGDIKPTLKSSADTGWIMFDDGTFGSAASGSSSRANADTQALFTLFFNNIGDVSAPLLTSGGGATTRAAQTNAATAWAANCRMSLPKVVGRAFGANGAGSGLTPRSLGSTIGEEAHVLSVAELPTGITSSGSNNIVVQSQNGLTGIPVTTSAANVTQSVVVNGSNSFVPASTSGSWAGVNSLSGNNTINVTSNNTSGSSHNNMQPTVFVNWMVKL
ncbi:hypothetical protein [Bradyrhizobium sp. JR18.2]|uniref:hypothetical protein n=1 Tax=Bradyrhizobium sp. JR18.2 TaxID=3156369 RepID=UPI00339260B8